LDDLDKELNTYAMRVKEWYGWHFPELAKTVVDNVAFAKVVKLVGFRTNTSTTDLSAILPEELEQEVKELAEISMGTEISDEDIFNIRHLCEQVISLSEYRTQLFEYLKNRMNAIAPNLTCMVGELVGARLISHAGSLMNLAKHPASTVQILGAEKALFRALKTKHDTPKYGLIYHASLVGQAAPKLKGKISRVLAAKTALSIRMDALGDKVTPDMGMENRLKVENRLRQLEGKSKITSASGPKTKTPTKKYEAPTDTSSYNTGADSTIGSGKKEKKEKKENGAAKEEKKEKKDKKKDKEEEKHDVKEEKKEKKEKKENGAAKKEKKESKGKPLFFLSLFFLFFLFLLSVVICWGSQ
jgi:nucleolar protein 58